MSNYLGTATTTDKSRVTTHKVTYNP